jgi:hypothetical protein
MEYIVKHKSFLPYDCLNEVLSNPKIYFEQLTAILEYGTVIFISSPKFEACKCIQDHSVTEQCAERMPNTLFSASVVSRRAELKSVLASAVSR